jgi:hypothetical protein
MVAGVRGCLLGKAAVSARLTPHTEETANVEVI